MNSLTSSNKFMFKVACLAVHALCSTALLAQQDSLIVLTADTLALEQVVITATRTEQQLHRTPFSIERVATPMQHWRQTRTMPEALSFTPGVFVQKTNHGGGSPFLRGLTGNQTLVLLDGIRFNNAIFRFGPNQYPNLIDAFTLDRIEVLKGSGSAQYGSDAMGGVIHAITRDPHFMEKKQWSVLATGRFTTQQMEYTGRAEAGFHSERFAVLGGITYRQFGDLYGGDTTGRQAPSGYTEQDWNLKLRAILSASALLTVASQQVTQRDVPLYHRVQLERFEYYNFDPQKMQLHYARLQLQGHRWWAQQVTLTALHKRSVEGRSYHRLGNTNFFDEEDRVSTWGATFDLASRFTKHWTANSGVEWYHDDVKSTRLRTTNGSETISRGLYPDGAVQQNLSAYTLHHLQWKHWQVETGLRYNVFTNKLPGEATSLPGLPKQDAIVIKPAAWVGNIAATYLTGRHAVYGSMSNGYRAPSIDDLGTLGLVDFRYEVPAYDLKPEKNLQTEIGYRWNGRKVQASAAIFYMHISDLISRVRQGQDSIQGYPVFIKTNDQEAFLRGAEASVNWQVTKGFSLQTFVATQYGQNLTRNEPMRRIPPLNGLVAARYAWNNWYAAAECQWAARQDRLAQGDKDDNRIPTGGTPAWQVVNLHTGWTNSQWAVRVSIINLLNEDYRTHGSGIHGMGRALTLSLTYGLHQNQKP